MLVRGRMGLGGRNRLRSEDRSAPLPDWVAGLAPAVEGRSKPRAVLEAGRGWLSGIAGGLASRRLILTGAAAWGRRLLGVLPMLAVVGLGVAKIFVGLGRGRPVGILFVLCVLLAIWIASRLLRSPVRTSAGDQALAAMRTEHARTRRAAPSDELSLAVALMGTTALTGTAFAEYRGALWSAEVFGGSGAGGDGDSGGGGCGGCGD